MHTLLAKNHSQYSSWTATSYNASVLIIDPRRRGSYNLLCLLGMMSKNYKTVSHFVNGLLWWLLCRHCILNAIHRNVTRVPHLHTEVLMFPKDSKYTWRCKWDNEVITANIRLWKWFKVSFPLKWRHWHYYNCYN